MGADAVLGGAGGSDDGRVVDAVRELLEPGAITMVFQPVIRLTGGGVVGYEALARFGGALPLRTDEWFDLAWRHNLGPELEMACWAATAAAGPPPNGAMLFVNCRPETLFDARAVGARGPLGGDVVLELSEKDAVHDYARLRDALDVWSVNGDRLAIDDTGAGYASLRHVVQLEPDYVKLDRSLIASIDGDRNRRAMVCALVAYANEAGAEVIAEGVERAEELTVLRDLGVHLAQGYLLARPDRPWPSTVWAPRLAAVAGTDGGEDRLRLALAEADTVHDACEATVAFLARGGSTMPSVYLERDGVLRCQAQRGLWQILDGMPPEAGITGRAFRTGRTVVVPDIEEDEAYLEAIPGVRAEACTPIRVGGTVVGAVNIESFVPFPQRAVGELVRATAQLGERLATIGLGASRSAAGRLPRLVTELAAVSDGGELVGRVCAAACDLAGMNSAMLSLDRGGERQITVYGPLGPTLAALDEAQHGELANLVSSVASCYTAGDATGACFRIAGSLRTAGARSVVVLPLDARGQRIGFLLVAHTTPVRIVTDEVEVLELLASHATLCLETARLMDDWRQKAATDPLTGLGNLAAFRATLELWRGEGIGASLLIADVDAFKSVNDRFGHLVGDRLLRQVADAMRSHVRPGDQLFRIGGDEFALLLRDAGEVEIGSVGGRVREAVDRELRPHGAALSIGATLLRPDVPVDDLIERADRSLYDAKRGGGGRLRLAS